MQPVAFLDDDPAKQRQQIYDIPVIGMIKDLNQALDRHQGLTRSSLPFPLRQAVWFVWLPRAAEEEFLSSTMPRASTNCWGNGQPLAGRGNYRLAAQRTVKVKGRIDWCLSIGEKVSLLGRGIDWTGAMLADCPMGSI